MNMERPQPTKIIYQFTPFDMSMGSNEKFIIETNLQHGIGKLLANIISDADLGDLGYLGAMICCDAKGGPLEINLQFRMSSAVDFVHNKATGFARPRIKPALRALENQLFFGEIEDVSRLAKQTLKAWKTKRGELKEDKSRREKDIDVLIVSCDPILTLLNVCDRKATDTDFDLKYFPIQETETYADDFFAPELFDDKVPCRVNVITGYGTSQEGFNPEDIETNYRYVQAIYEKMKRRKKAEKKTEKVTGEKPYKTKMKNKKDKGKKNKKQKEKTGSYGKF